MAGVWDIAVESTAYEIGSNPTLIRALCNNVRSASAPYVLQPPPALGGERAAADDGALDDAFA